MKTNKATVCVLSILFFSTGCANYDSPDSHKDFMDSENSLTNNVTVDIDGSTNDGTDSQSMRFYSYNEESYKNNFPSYEQIAEKYPDKTILVWTIEETGYERNYPFRTNEVNEYLDSLAVDYRVCFYPIKAMQNEDMSDFYTDYITEMIENGEQVDIVYSSFTTIDESGNNAYHKYIYNGIFEPLNKYFDTDLGKKLYEIMPVEHWKALTVNGNIYGIDGAMHTLSDDYGYYINAELAEKYGFDIYQPFESQVDVLDKIAANEKCDLIATYNNFGTASYTVDIKEITPAVYFDEAEMTAKCILDNPEFIKRLRFIYDMRKKGYVVDLDLPQSDSFFILRTHFAGGKEHYKNTETVDITYNNHTVKSIPVFADDTSVRSSYMATGISSSSKHKDMAFELLALTQTDPYLNNLLTYGKEGEDYQLANGIVDTIINPVSLDRFPNKMICYPTASDAITPEEYQLIYKNANCSETLGFAFDGRDVIPQSSATSNLFMAFNFLDVDDLDKAITNLRTELEQNGINDVIDACNQQYQEYIS